MNSYDNDQCGDEESDFSLMMWCVVSDALCAMYTPNGHHNTIEEVYRNIQPVFNICESEVSAHIATHIHVAGMTGIPPFTRNGS